MKTPAELRSSLESVLITSQALAKYLRSKRGERAAGLGVEAERTADRLESILSLPACQVPENFKVAIVGRFKVGKSSFVNELIGAVLAGENHSPETAAVTTFVYGQTVKASIKLVSKEEWEEQKRIFESDSSNQDVHRVKVWRSFLKPQKTVDGKEISFDLNHIEANLLSSPNQTVEIDLEVSDDKKAERIFRDRLKEFTSANKPHHCLVKEIQIQAPSSILDNGVEIVDTPGLDDTERFRVSLTEESVREVDSILFLTLSGASYSQSDKDFLLSLLRKGTIKQLLIVVTQVDQTHEKHMQSVEDGLVDEESLFELVAKEKSRIRREMIETLQELTLEDSGVSQSYIEQFSEIEIVFTSVRAHRDFLSKRSAPKIELIPGDPGGINRFRERLASLLSRESRLASASKSIRNHCKEAIDDLCIQLEEKTNALKNTHEKEEVERKLRIFRDKFEEICKSIQADLDLHISGYQTEAEALSLQHKLVIENIVLRSEKELERFKTNDIGRHWRTRRSGYWGYMSDLQTRIANKIFPRVQKMLTDHVDLFSGLVDKLEKKIKSISTSMNQVSKTLELGTIRGGEAGSRIKQSLEKVIQTAQEELVEEQQRIIKLLDDFVSEEIEERISSKRAEVRDIWGKGTTAAQAEAVDKFYSEVMELLSDALSGHLVSRNAEFSRMLLKAAETTPKRTFSEFSEMLDQSLENLRQAGEANLAGQKSHVEGEVAEIQEKLSPLYHSIYKLDEFFADVSATESRQSDEGVLTGTTDPQIDQETKLLTTVSDWANEVCNHANVHLSTIRLIDGDTGWPLSRIFEERYFKNALKFLLIDPYLHAPHQQRNLKELLAHVLEFSRPKAFEVLTTPASLEHQDRSNAFIERIVKEVFHVYGLALDFRFETGLHDRSFTIDTGVRYKLSRGLDIYKPASGTLGRQENRRVRATEIDLFVCHKDWDSSGQ